MADCRRSPAPAGPLPLGLETSLHGRPLSLRVVTVDAAAPDVVTVHVRYGRGQAQVTVSAAGEEERQEQEEGGAGAPHSARAAAAALAGPPGAGSLSCGAASRALAGREGQPSHCQLEAHRSNRPLSDTEHPVVASSSADPGQSSASSAVTRRHQGVSITTTEGEAVGSRSQTESGALEETGPLFRSRSTSMTPPAGSVVLPAVDLDQICIRDYRVISTSDSSESLRVPFEILQHILSYLTWQQLLGARRVSRRWKKAVDFCLARCQKLFIGRYDLPGVLNDQRLEQLLKAMPALKSLAVEWRMDGRKLNIDKLTQHCQNLLEVDLTKFRLDAWSLEQLCAACPGLQKVKLPRNCDDACVEALLDHLPGLRVLDLDHTRVNGTFLARLPGSVEKLSLAGCKYLISNNIRQVPQSVRKMMSVHDLSLGSSALDVVETLRLFPQLQRLVWGSSDWKSGELLQVSLCEHLRDLDLSPTPVFRASDLIAVLTGCPQLERLSLACYLVDESVSLQQLAGNHVFWNLRELNISQGHLPTEAVTAILSRCPRLERLLAVRARNIDLSVCLVQLSRSEFLRYLDISPPDRNLDWGHRITTKALLPPTHHIQPAALTSLIIGCPELKVLRLSNCTVSESSCFRQLAHSSQLRELGLPRITAAAADDLAQGLSGCPLLERLSVANNDLPLEQCLPPTGLPNLLDLHVTNSALTNNTLRRMIGQLPKLRSLSLPDCSSVKEEGLTSYLPCFQQLRSLDLTGENGVSIKTLDWLRETRLCKLGLGITSVSVEELARMVLGCSSLKYIWLNWTGKDAMEALIEELTSQLPPSRVLVIFIGERLVVKYLSQLQSASLRLVKYSSSEWDQC